MTSPFLTLAGKTPIEPLFIFIFGSVPVVETNTTSTVTSVPRPVMPPTGAGSDSIKVFGATFITFSKVKLFGLIDKATPVEIVQLVIDAPSPMLTSISIPVLALFDDTERSCIY